MARLVAKPSFIGLRKGCPSSASGVIDSRKPTSNEAARAADASREANGAVYGERLK
jgi:hypothetical protein